MVDQKLILLVEDDRLVREMARQALLDAGYRVQEAETLALALDLFRKHRPDLVILDLNLPDGSGLDFCREVRAHKELAATPVVMLTARKELAEKAEGFSAGADHYLVKPISPSELLMWVGSLLRRLQLDGGAGDELRAGDLRIDVRGHMVHYRGQTVADLTVKEFDLLCFLVKKKRQVITRKYILSNLWHTVAVDNLVDVHISNLRKKLPPEVSDMIQTIQGKGFRFLD